jgi:hypothetical protein
MHSGAAEAAHRRQSCAGSAGHISAPQSVAGRAGHSEGGRRGALAAARCAQQSAKAPGCWLWQPQQATVHCSCQSGLHPATACHAAPATAPATAPAAAALCAYACACACACACGSSTSSAACPTACATTSPTAPLALPPQGCSALQHGGGAGSSGSSSCPELCRVCPALAEAAAGGA